MFLGSKHDNRRFLPCHNSYNLSINLCDVYWKDKPSLLMRLRASRTEAACHLPADTVAIKGCDINCRASWTWMSILVTEYKIWNCTTICCAFVIDSK